MAFFLSSRYVAFPPYGGFSTLRPARFLAYLVVALQTIEASIGVGVLGALRSSQPPPVEAILTALLNDLTTLSDSFILVLDDYHVLDAELWMCCIRVQGSGLLVEQRLTD
jgi:ATP/maltotriose-dependent transcriptional regulator MalT